MIIKNRLCWHCYPINIFMSYLKTGKESANLRIPHCPWSRAFLTGNRWGIPRFEDFIPSPVSAGDFQNLGVRVTVESSKRSISYRPNPLGLTIAKHGFSTTLSQRIWFPTVTLIMAIYIQNPPNQLYIEKQIHHFLYSQTTYNTTFSNKLFLYRIHFHTQSSAPRGMETRNHGVYEKCKMLLE